MDQFLWSEQRFSEAVVNYDVIHNVSNVSDHEPILLNMERAVTRYDSIPKQFRPKPAWYRACETQFNDYASHLRCELGNIVLPHSALLCHDVKCCDNDINHLSDINRYAEAISTSCLSSASCTIPLTSGKQSGRIPGWSEYVAPYKEKSQFWQWLQCGRPKTGVVSDVVRRLVQTTIVLL